MQDRFLLRRGRFEGAVARLQHLFGHLLFELVDRLLVEDAFADQEHLQAGDGIALGLFLALGLGAIEALIVGERVRIGTDDVPVHEPRPFAGADVLHRAGDGGIALDRIGAVALLEMEVGEIGHQARDVAARGLHLAGHGDGVLVVLDQEQNRQLQVGGRVQRLPELALAGGAFPGGDVDHLVAVEGHILELAVVAGNFLGRLGMAREVAAGFGASDGVQELAAGGRGAGDDVELAAGPVRGHLASAGAGIVGRAHRLQQHIERLHAQGEGQRAVAIVGEEPVISRLEGQSGRHQQRLMASARDLEEDLLLALEQDLAVVDAPRQEHQPVDLDELLAGEALIGLVGSLKNFASGLGYGLGGSHSLPRMQSDPEATL